MRVEKKKRGETPKGDKRIKGKDVLTDRIDEKKDTLLRTPIAILEIDDTTEKTLQNLGIETLGDLVQKTEEDLDGLDHKKVFLIRWALSKVGLSLYSESNKMAEQKGKEDSDSGTDIRVLKLRKWTQKALELADIRTVEQLVEMSDVELGKIRELGRGRIKDIRRAIRRLDLSNMSENELIGKAEDIITGEVATGRGRPLMKADPIVYNELEKRIGVGQVEELEKNRRDDLEKQAHLEDLAPLAEDSRAEIGKLLLTVNPEDLQATLKLLGKL